MKHTTLLSALVGSASLVLGMATPEASAQNVVVVRGGHAYAPAYAPAYGGVVYAQPVYAAPVVVQQPVVVHQPVYYGGGYGYNRGLSVRTNDFSLRIGSGGGFGYGGYHGGYHGGYYGGHGFRHPGFGSFRQPVVVNNNYYRGGGYGRCD